MGGRAPARGDSGNRDSWAIGWHGGQRCTRGWIARRPRTPRSTEGGRARARWRRRGSRRPGTLWSTQPPPPDVTPRAVGRRHAALRKCVVGVGVFRLRVGGGVGNTKLRRRCEPPWPTRSLAKRNLRVGRDVLCLRIIFFRRFLCARYGPHRRRAVEADRARCGRLGLIFPGRSAARARKTANPDPKGCYGACDGPRAILNRHLRR